MSPTRPTIRRNTFPRVAHLKRRRLIRPLFDRSRDDVGTVTAGCIRLLFRAVPRTETGQSVPVQVGFAPGRTRTAVERNRIRRLLREVYRVHQHALVDLFLHRSETLTVMILFRGKVAKGDTCIGQDLPRALERLAAQVNCR
ncbi:MAG TPA: ribonuclease P protein component [Rhodothermales bacterium]|nr:ribonuclease P protein component [Rhodothermales bacterium]